MIRQTAGFMLNRTPARIAAHSLNSGTPPDRSSPMATRRLMQAVDLVRSGRILALKGLGGFQLIVDARNESAVVRLRSRKHREEKPFALMAPSLEAIEGVCAAFLSSRNASSSPRSHRLCCSSEERAPDGWPPRSRPAIPSLGVMLPYTPLHHLLLRELGFEIVATSGNLSDEPICIDENEAVERLGGIADGFLVHDRPIVRHVDDSVVRVMRGPRARAQARARLRAAACAFEGSASLCSRPRRASEKQRGPERRHRGLCQPAHRRPCDQSGLPSVPPGLGGSASALGGDAGGHRMRHAS